MARRLMLLTVCAYALVSLMACAQTKPYQAPSRSATSKPKRRVVQFPATEGVYAKCASFAQSYYVRAYSFLRCADGVPPVFSFLETSFSRAQGRDLLTAIADWRNQSCAKISKQTAVQTDGFELVDGRLVKKTFAGEAAFVRYRAPRSLNLIAFDYRPQNRKSWEGERYVLLSYTVQDELGKPKSRVELGIDPFGVTYIDVEARSGEDKPLERLYRFDVPQLEPGEHVLAFGQWQTSNGSAPAESFFALDGKKLFRAQSFFVPDLFSGFTALVELPGDPGAVTLLGMLSGEPVCPQEQQK